MQKEQVDQELSFKKRARRRLVGAIALVLLMVIILPMLLEDRSKKAQEEDVEIIMPNEQPLDLEASDALDADSDIDFDESVVQSADAGKSSSNESAVSEVVELPKPERAKSTTTANKEPVEQADDKKAMTEEKPNAKKETAISDKFYVQIGVFSDPSNVKKLQVKLNELGYKSLTEKITTDSGVKTRLRTESFTGRNEAAIALENIKDAGLAGMVVSQK